MADETLTTSKVKTHKLSIKKGIIKNIYHFRIGIKCPFMFYTGSIHENTLVNALKPNGLRATAPFAAKTLKGILFISND